MVNSTHENALAVFQGKQIRRKWHNNEWYFVVVDIVKALTDSVNPSDYIKKLKVRDTALNEGWGQIVTLLRIQTPGGPQNLNCVNENFEKPLVFSKFSFVNFFCAGAAFNPISN